MNPVARGRGGNASRRRASVLLGALALAVPAVSRRAQAQNDTVRTKPVSTFEVEVRRLTQEMNTQRRLQIEFMNLLRESQLAAQRRTTDSARVRAAAAQAQFATARLRVVASQQLQLRRRLDSLCGVDEQPQGWMGLLMVGPSELSRRNDGPVLTRYLDTPVVESVDPGSPAEKAGLRSGDVLVQLNGKDIRQQEINFARLLRPGAKVAVRVVRGRARENFSIVIERRPESFGGPCPWIDANVAVAAPSAAPNAFVYGFATTPSTPDAPRTTVVRSRGAEAPPAPAGVVISSGPSRAYVSPMVAGFADGSSGVAGARLLVVDRDLGSYFDVDRGLLVLSVLQGTVALRAGLKAGDVLLSADGVDLASPVTLQRVMNGSKEHAVKLVVMRNHKRRTMDLRW